MASHQIVLYHYPGSTSTFPYLLLEFAGLEYELRISNPTDSDFAKTNPKKQVPVLIVDGHTITENAAIAQTINQLALDKQLFGETPPCFIRVSEWLSWLTASVHAQAWGPYIRPWRFTIDESEEAQANVKAAGRRNVIAKWEMIESRLAELPPGSWAVGNTFTAVDAYLLQMLRFAKNGMGLDVQTDYPRWTALVEKVKEIPVLGKAFEADEARKQQLGQMVAR